MPIACGLCVVGDVGRNQAVASLLIGPDPNCPGFRVVLEVVLVVNDIEVRNSGVVSGLVLDL